MTSVNIWRTEGLGELSQELSELVRKNSEELGKRVSVEIFCQVDADCPSGYVCVSGECVKEIV